MLLDGGEFGGARILAPRTVEMMRTNHLQAEAAQDDARRAPAGAWASRSCIDAAAAGEPYSDGSFDW